MPVKSKFLSFDHYQQIKTSSFFLEKIYNTQVEHLAQKLKILIGLTWTELTSSLKKEKNIILYKLLCYHTALWKYLVCLCLQLNPALTIIPSLYLSLITTYCGTVWWDIEIHSTDIGRSFHYGETTTVCTPHQRVARHAKFILFLLSHACRLHAYVVTVSDLTLYKKGQIVASYSRSVKLSNKISSVMYPVISIPADYFCSIYYLKAHLRHITIRTTNYDIWPWFAFKLVVKSQNPLIQSLDILYIIVHSKGSTSKLSKKIS